ncbi:5-formyltetrahydrofolate cyclo-ligase [Levilactobacillus humaensis]|uniref:5-formyltetrahydrofolate cyclo-ligase n=1 Tax=Levilactobacillus humaensis TaxID=2950375 RepID=UPI0021C4418F|nr:5-formyltetrahydrofolate cyclo-ligase [Levilactobacillus humaensis]
MATKANLRQQTIQALKQLSPAKREMGAQSLYEQLFALPEWQQATTIATTISTDLELSTAAIIAAAQQAGKTVAVPQTLPARQMAFHTLTADTHLVKTAFGLMEPEDGEIILPANFDLLVVPGLLYAQSGERVGFGGGYYDRYLPRTTGTKVALAFSVQQVSAPTWQVDPFDVILDRVLVASTK